MDLKKKILLMIVDKLGLEDDVDVENFDYDTPLFDAENGLGLDSIDVLELYVGVKKEFGIKVPNEKRSIFKSVSTIFDYISEVIGDEDEQ